MGEDLKMHEQTETQQFGLFLGFLEETALPTPPVLFLQQITRESGHRTVMIIYLNHTLFFIICFH